MDVNVFIEENKNNINVKEIAEKFNLSIPTVYRHLRMVGVKPKKNHSDKRLNEFESFFDAITSFGSIEAKLLDHNIQQEPLKRLLDFKAIRLENGHYYLNKMETAFLKNFYEKDVLCYIYAPTMHSMIGELHSRGRVVVEDKLFSRPEQKYLNFILNKAEFSDGFDLRNKYSHGTVSSNDQENLRDYLEFLKIMVLIVIKINEEFCLLEDKMHFGG